MNFSTIVWNVDPEIVKISVFSIRYYGLFFALAFLLGYYIFTKFFKKEKIDIQLLDKLLLYIVLGTVIGARLGHVLFYEPQEYLKNPLDILKIHEGGLASHGGAIGVLLAAYLFVRKYKWKYLWLLDRLAIVVALAAFFIRAGNLMNSEIYGIPTTSKAGFIYGRDLTRDLTSQDEINTVHYDKVKTDSLLKGKYQPLILEVVFEKRLKNEEGLKSYTSTVVQQIIQRQKSREDVNVILPPGKFDYKIKRTDDKSYLAKVPVLGIPRHPTHIYEAVSYLLIFFLLLAMYYKNDGKPGKGMIIGIFLILLFTARFFIEFIKEEQVSFEKGMQLNMGQWLSLPFILSGFLILVYSRWRKIIEKSKN